ncbi:MAG TPA: alpha hydrolase [Methanoregulaceae archaeon]|nr:alpha hydrolase [Methanoregulaceae archaeon]HPD74572.1 alpha hydrolase [Methanoregulaceae archaeon]HRY74844.1 alpha hydrolase [Methanoregulaceae archaeon]
MTDAGVLYSGGKDSSLAAIMLGTLYEVELNTFTFDPARPLPSVEAAARSLGFPMKRRVFPRGTLDEAADRVIRDGFPNTAINQVHRIAVESLCNEYEVVADGTRFNDRVPMLTRAEVQSLEGRTGSSYVRPLLGFTRREVDRFADRFLLVRHGETGTIPNGDYETEIREACRIRGIDCGTLFPQNHDQSLVIGRKTAF